MDFLTSLQRTSRRLTDTVSNTLDDLLDDNENKRQQPGCELAAGAAVARGALLAGPLEKRSDWLGHFNVRRVTVLPAAALRGRV